MQTSTNKEISPFGVQAIPNIAERKCLDMLGQEEQYITYGGPWRAFIYCRIRADAMFRCTGRCAEEFVQVMEFSRTVERERILP